MNDAFRQRPIDIETLKETQRTNKRTEIDFARVVPDGNSYDTEFECHRRAGQRIYDGVERRMSLEMLMDIVEKMNK